MYCYDCEYFDRFKDGVHGKCIHTKVGVPSVDEDERDTVVCSSEIIVGETFGCVHYSMQDDDFEDNYDI